ncbi:MULTISPECIES: type IX secretion system anionic LPS delivery protein PorZ [unclassified Flavobacterium]|uniref:type IX secretion system anionic LPS delivery protein PorZ n=1 Tax=unclassified Flavobacterium TaxID=196869 RepID=UPI003F92CED5
MKKRFLSLLLLLTLQMSFSQNTLSWQGYFSFNDVKDLSASSMAVYAASENALFSINTNNSQIKTTTTVDGLSGQTISALYYSSQFNKSIVGYENGLITVINEVDGSMLKVVDIINKQLPANRKKVNYFLEYQGILYISCDFGIVQFNLQTMLFGDTYFIGDNGAEISVNQTAIQNGFIYAATNSGIRRADITNKNLNDYRQWQLLDGGNWLGIVSFGEELIAINIVGALYKYNTSLNSFVLFKTLPQAAVDIRVSGSYMIISTPQTISIYDAQINLVREIKQNQISIPNVVFNCATIVGEVVYIGTKENGLLSTSISGVAAFENTTPMGPIRNNIFAMQATSTALWAVYGDYDATYNPYDLDSYGLSKYTKEGWLNIPYEKVLGAKSIVRVMVNPNNENEVFMGSSYSGLLKIENDVPTYLYNQTNSGLDEITFIPGYHDDVRVNGGVFDKAGNLWVNNSLVKEGLKVLKSNGQWQSYSMDKILDKSEDVSYGRMVIDKYGTKWMATNRDGVIGFNENNNTFKKITFGSDAGNLPTVDARALAVDNRNQLWIGTNKGLRVLPNVGSFQTDNQLATNAIIILDDNLAQELLYEQFITDIAVDGANNKWIATADSGVFMVSANGQETKYHFTINNSPLPSNVINDIDINPTTGEVFIATDKGLISFKGVATASSDDLNNVYVYPNPVRPQYTGTVKIAGLINKANVKITDITGSLVYETTAEGGTIEWDTTAFGKYKVASGVYMIFISAQDGLETKVKKVMIIR